jgi:hypothetical protein
MLIYQDGKMVEAKGKEQTALAYGQSLKRSLS